MLSTPLDDTDAEKLDLSAYRAEWKWDGIRVQLVARGGERRLYSRSGDEIGGAFPEIVGALAFAAILDGALLVRPADGGERKSAAWGQRVTERGDIGGSRLI